MPSAAAQQPTITDWRTFDPKRDLVFHEPKQNSHRGFGIKLQVSRDGQAIDMYHQTPVLRMPFAIGEMEGDYGKKYEATFSFPGYQYDENAPGQSVFPGDPEMEAYHRFLHGWDEFNLNLAASKTKEWFKKQYSKEVIKELYKYQLKESSEPEKYSQLFRTKVPFRYDNFNCSFYDSKGNAIGSDQITRGSKVIALVKTTSMWFAGKGFGVSHQVEQLMVMDEETFTGCAIMVDGKVPVPETPSEHDGAAADDVEGGGDPPLHKRARLAPPVGA